MVFWLALLCFGDSGIKYVKNGSMLSVTGVLTQPD